MLRWLLRESSLLPSSFGSFGATTVSGSVGLTSAELWAEVKQLPPHMTDSAHKGQCGRIGVIGGSKAYTGAPYFAAMTAMKMGVDLSTVFCSVEAGLPIKVYSPDLMVRPCLFPAHLAAQAVQEFEAAGKKTGGKQEKTAEDRAVELIVADMAEWTSRLNVLVIGPGMGKDPLMSRTVAGWIRHARDAAKDGKVTPLVIDGDGISTLIEHPELLLPDTASPPSSASSSTAAPASAFASHVLLTPNAMEFRRLWTKFLPNDAPPDFDVPINDHLQLMAEIRDGAEVLVEHPLVADTAKLARALGGVTLCRKGTIDIISDGQLGMIVAVSGCPRRVGGQGDLLAGACGAFLAWAGMATDQAARAKADLPVVELPMPTTMMAAYAASTFCRSLQRESFSRHGRSMLASHLIDAVPAAMQRFFPVAHVTIANKL